jgi:hypothetical protein
MTFSFKFITVPNTHMKNYFSLTFILLIQSNIIGHIKLMSFVK